MHICMTLSCSVISVLFTICLVILFGISSGQKSSKEGCWLRKNVWRKKYSSVCLFTSGVKIAADCFPLKRGLSTNCFCSNIFRHSSQSSCSLVVFRHILQLHHVHGRLQRRHHHHDSQLSPPPGGHSWDAKLGEIITKMQICWFSCWWSSFYFWVFEY